MIQFNLNSDEPLKMSVKEAVVIKGEDGKSAYQIALDNGFVGTQEEWLESLHGKDGKDGQNGQDGKTPVKGTDYFDGKDGKDGKDGQNGVSCTHKWDGTTLTVISASGTSSANLKGDKGDTPVKGTDYLTENEVAEIVNDISTDVVQKLPYETWTFELTDGTLVQKEVMFR